ncbi:MAG: hypothetical protein M0Z48_04455 [Nitrospiraceae bacterium]|nr:hypothetical protein [Nitrospiraceae bacterium]
MKKFLIILCLLLPLPSQASILIPKCECTGGSGKPMLIIGLYQHAVAASATYYFVSAYNDYSTGPAFNKIYMPVSCLAEKLYVTIMTAQPADNSMTVTLQQNGANTLLLVTFPAGAAANTTESDLTDSVAISTGDTLEFAAQNNSTSTSAEIGYVSIICQ